MSQDQESQSPAGCASGERVRYSHGEGPPPLFEEAAVGRLYLRVCALERRLRESSEMLQSNHSATLKRIREWLRAGMPTGSRMADTLGVYDHEVEQILDRLVDARLRAKREQRKAAHAATVPKSKR